MTEDRSGVEALSKVQKYLRENPHCPFTEDELSALQRVAAREIAWTYVGFLGARYKTILTYIGFFIAAFLAVRGGAIDWIQGVVQK